MSFNSVVFWICAHQDDWQLFRGQGAYNNMFQSKCVFIYTTAGNLGVDDGLWKARESGAVASSILTIPQDPAEKLTSNVVTINGHRLQKWVRGSVTSYCLRLPAGDWGQQSGYEGYPLYGNQTISKLQDGSIPSITAVDNSTVYNGWNDLCDTVLAIMETEGKEFDTPQWISTSDPSSNSNPRDHCDHYTTGKITADLQQYNRTFWLGYVIKELPVNLEGFELMKKWIVFMPYGLNTFLYSCLNDIEAGKTQQDAMDPSLDGKSYFGDASAGESSLRSEAIASETT